MPPIDDTTCHQLWHLLPRDATAHAPDRARTGAPSSSARPPQASLALRCDEPGRQLCLFTQTNYQGELSLWGITEDGQCQDLEDAKLSFRASLWTESVLYESPGCSGRSEQASPGEENPDFGFAARSWKQLKTLCGAPDLLCLFDEPDFQGGVTQIGDIGDQTCRGNLGGKRSYAAGGRREGYLYESNDCSGSGLAVLGDTKNDNLSIVANSWKQACVSCRSGTPR